MARVFVLWDESHLWGVLVLRALRALGIPHRILRANHIAEGALAGNPTPFGGLMGGSASAGPSAPVAPSGPPGLLIVPGGWARGRALRLGPSGMQAIRDFVAGGGAYLGFCGGAGLALTGRDSLNLCPWGRMGFAGRLQHFLSGRVRLARGAEGPQSFAGGGLTAPVWWPAQFAPGRGGDGVEVLASYAGLGDDFWVADLDLSLLPEETLADWEALYGMQVRPDFLLGRPAVIAGTYGQGRYVLSYPHLETPDEPQANAWLARILLELGAGPCATASVPPWNAGSDKCLWPDPALLAARAGLERVMALGERHLLLFWRNPWLLGWRRGLPGPGINSLYALICEALASAPCDAAQDYWRERGPEFARLSRLFCSGLSGLLLAERLDMTARATEGLDGVGGADGAFARSLRETRRALFGAPPAVGGLCGELLGMLEEVCARLWGAG